MVDLQGKDEITRFSTAVLYDAARRLGLEIALRGVSPIAAGLRLAAPAYTVGFTPVGQRPKSGQNFYDIIDAAPKGSALVFGANVDRWLFGGNLSLFAQLSGIAGMVLDGCLRDIAELRERGYPVFARGVSVSGYSRDRMLGELGGTIVCGEVTVATGDVVVGDDDGVVCLPASRIDDILFQAEDILELDLKLARDIESRRPLASLHETRLRWSVPRSPS